MHSSDFGFDRDRRKSSIYDIEGLRRKLQRETIEHHGLHSVQLWSAAAQALSLARTILSRKGRHDSVTIAGRVFVSKTMIESPGQVISRISAFPSTQNMKENHPSNAELSAKDLPEGIAAAASAYDDCNMPLRFPVRVWTGIIRQAADPHSVLSATQLDNIVKYARDFDTLATERETLHKDPSTQKWLLMEAIGCLSYEN